MDKFRISGMISDSIVDGPGLRLCIFFQGCPHGCPGCHNPETHDPEGGRPCDFGEIEEALNGNPLLSGITLSGGEPFMQAGPAAEIAKAAREKGLSVVIYTGYTAEELSSLIEKDEQAAALFWSSDYIIEGRFDISQRTLELRFRGSANQRIIDVKRTGIEKRTVFCEL